MPQHGKIYLHNVHHAADAVQAAFGGSAHAEILRNTSVVTFGAALAGRRMLFYEGHGDARLSAENVPAFVGSDGGPESVSITTLAETVRAHVREDESEGLKLVVLNGCKTRALGDALRTVAAVPSVLCWDTILHDEAAAIFSSEFATRVAAGDSLHVAFDAACKAVTSVTEPGLLDNGIPAMVQKYELFVDPSDKALVHPANHLSSPRRLKVFAPSKAQRGRIAAGSPRLLDAKDEAAYKEAPAIGQGYVPRLALRNAVVGRVLSCGGASTASLVGLKGMGGVGKSMLAAAIVRDDEVRRHFADGILWVDALVRGTDPVESIVYTVAERLHTRLLARRFGIREPPPMGGGAETVKWMATLVQRRGLRILVVLDNVTRKELIEALSRSGLSLLITTREAEVASAAGATQTEVDTVDEATARAMLAGAAGLAGADALPAEAEAVLTDCAGLPLTLAIAGALCKGGGSSVWTRLTVELTQAIQTDEPSDAFLDAAGHVLEASGHSSLRAVVRVSRNRLPRAVAIAYGGLALCPKRMRLDDSLLGALLGLGADSANICMRKEWRATLVASWRIRCCKRRSTARVPCTIYSSTFYARRARRLKHSSGWSSG